MCSDIIIFAVKVILIIMNIDRQKELYEEGKELVHAIEKVEGFLLGFYVSRNSGNMKSPYLIQGVKKEHLTKIRDILISTRRSRKLKLDGYEKVRDIQQEE